MSRRALLRGRFLAACIAGVDHVADAVAGRVDTHDPARDAPHGLRPINVNWLRQAGQTNSIDRSSHTMLLHRSPGAVDEQTFASQCTRCNACVEACPHDAIVPAPARFRQAAATPMIDPSHQPCWMCSDTPCIAACEEDVLQLQDRFVMGVAHIDAQACLAHQGTTCFACGEQCPVDGAIDFVDGRPRINDDTCAGCGVCQFVCPAPHNAVMILPARDRPVPRTIQGDRHDD